MIYIRGAAILGSLAMAAVLAIQGKESWKGFLLAAVIFAAPGFN